MEKLCTMVSISSKRESSVKQDLWQAHYQILSIIFLKEFIKLNVNTDTTKKKYKNCGIKYKYCDCFFEYINFKDNLIEHEYLFCNKNYQQKFDEKLKKQFLNTYKIFNQNNNKFILMFRKDVHPHEYMDDGEKFKET